MKFRADEGEATPPRMRVHGRSPHPAEYAAWREMRRNTRQVEEPGADAAWNHLISVFVHGKAGAGLVATLESLRSQTYRNIEIIVGGPQTAELPPRDDFASLRGMFPEPEADPLTLLADPASDRLWRGSHIMFAQAGTLFDDDAFELLNALLNQGSAESRPDLVLCDHDRLGPGGECDGVAMGCGVRPGCRTLFPHFQPRDPGREIRSRGPVSPPLAGRGAA